MRTTRCRGNCNPLLLLTNSYNHRELIKLCNNNYAICNWVWTKVGVGSVICACPLAARTRRQRPTPGATSCLCLSCLHAYECALRALHQYISPFWWPFPHNHPFDFQPYIISLRNDRVARIIPVSLAPLGTLYRHRIT